MDLDLLSWVDWCCFFIGAIYTSMHDKAPLLVRNTHLNQQIPLHSDEASVMVKYRLELELYVAVQQEAATGSPLEILIGNDIAKL